MVAILLIGMPLLGKLDISISQFVLIILNTILVIITYVSIFNFISMLCSEITVSTIVSIILFLTMFIICSSLNSIINTPKYITTTFYDEDGIAHVIESEPNPNYPSKSKLQTAETIYYLMPTGQALEIADGKAENLIKLPIYSTILIFLFNILGLYLFNKKELK